MSYALRLDDGPLGSYHGVPGYFHCLFPLDVPLRLADQESRVDCCAAWLAQAFITISFVLERLAMFYSSPITPKVFRDEIRLARSLMQNACEQLFDEAYFGWLDTLRDCDPHHVVRLLSLTSTLLDDFCSDGKFSDCLISSLKVLC